MQYHSWLNSNRIPPAHLCLRPWISAAPRLTLLIHHLKLHDNKMINSEPRLQSEVAIVLTSDVEDDKNVNQIMSYCTIKLVGKFEKGHIIFALQFFDYYCNYCSKFHILIRISGEYSENC